MSGHIDDVVNAAITQTGGIEDIIKTVVAQTTQEVRRENDILQASLGNANRKIEWLESVIKYEEQFKARALQEQRAHYLQIGGLAFQRIVHDEEMQHSKDVHEIASLESRFLGDRNDISTFGRGWYNGQHKPTPFELAQFLRAENVFPPSEEQLLRAHNIIPLSEYGDSATPPAQVATPVTRARSSTTVTPYLQSTGLPVSQSPVTRPRSSTLMNPDAQLFYPSSGSPVRNAGSKKPQIDSLAVAPAPRVYGLRNAQGRYDSPIICPKCRKIFAFNGWTRDHFENCKGAEAAANTYIGPYIPPNPQGGPSNNNIHPITRRPEMVEPTAERAKNAEPLIVHSDLPFRAASRSFKSDQQ